MYLKEVPFIGSMETIITQNLESDNLSVFNLVIMNL